MKRELVITKALQALIVLQLLVGVFSVITLNMGRGIAVFGSAALIYLGMTIIKQLASIKELLSYSAVQQAPEKELLSVQSYLEKKRSDTPSKKAAPRGSEVRREAVKREVMTNANEAVAERHEEKTQLPEDLYAPRPVQAVERPNRQNVRQG